MLVLKTQNSDYFLSLPVSVFCELIQRLDEEKRKEEIRQQWVSMLPMMSCGMLKYKSFNEYYDQCTGKNIDLRSEKEIRAEVDEIRNTIRKEKEE